VIVTSGEKILEEAFPAAPTAEGASPGAVARRVTYALAVGVLAWGLWTQRAFFHDDAFISLRYAARFLAGDGLTWSAAERVEGFSHPLWLAQLIVAGALGAPLPAAAQALGIAYALATVLLWRRADAHPAGLLALSSVPGFALWAVGGLETTSWVFWVLAAIVAIRRAASRPECRWDLRAGIATGLVLSAVALTRPEGPAVALAAVVALLALARPRHAAMAGGVVFVAFGAYLAFRIAYYGDWLANAARAKSSGVPAAIRLASATAYVVETSPQWVAAVAVAAWLVISSKPGIRRLWLAAPIVPLLLLIPLGGGDHMPGARFIVPVVAAVCLMGGMAAARRVRLESVAAGLAVIAAGWQLSVTSPMPRDPAAAVGEIVGRALGGLLPSGTLVALATAGSVPYFAPSLAFLDTLGLNDRHIARTPLPEALVRACPLPGHCKGDGKYVLSRSPDVVILGGANGYLQTLFLSDEQLLGSPEFRRRYAPAVLWVELDAAALSRIRQLVQPGTRHLPVVLFVRLDSPTLPSIRRVALSLSGDW
jgi:hypothetical protein